MRRTKIVATLGPASADLATIQALLESGVNVVRLNFSHGSHASHAATIQLVRQASKRSGCAVALLQDLAGPKIRVGNIAAGTIELRSGQDFTLTARDVPGDQHLVSVNYKKLPNDVKPGDPLLLNDGALELEVGAVTDLDIHCQVIVGGPLAARKGINLPQGSISAPILSAKDCADLAFGLEQGVDLVAVSFVRSRSDLDAVRAQMRALGSTKPIVAKIEKHEALQHIDAILACSEAIMVARGDLGVETPVQHIPKTQKMLIAKANQAGKPVITATQMLMSMVENPRPTRAEVMDVANAVFDGSDAVMLSEETAVGQYPIAAVQIMDKTLQSAESIFPYTAWTRRFGALLPEDDLQAAMAHSVCQLAEQINADAILICTMSGSTARKVVQFRPKPLVIALSPDPQTQQFLNLLWGTVALHLPMAASTDAMQEQAIHQAMNHGLLQPGQLVVLTAGLPLQKTGVTNMLKIVKL